MISFYQFVLKVGTLWSIALTTIFSAISSVLLTYFFVVIVFVLPKPNIQICLLISALVPLIVAPIASDGFIKLIFKINKLEAEARHSATYDLLTGLLSRCAFYSFAEQQLSLAYREKNCIAVMIADLDGFKKINDNHGHAAGDDVLKALGEIISGVTRDSDIAGRLGGDEFIFCLLNASTETANIFANRLHETVNNRVIEYEGKKISFKLSIGVCLSDSDEPSNLNELVRKADIALYKSKAGIGNLQYG
jgi:diguanylate cyclase (GGDEF)-like protein